jgi:hypothetical protein
VEPAGPGCFYPLEAPSDKHGIMAAMLAGMKSFVPAQTRHCIRLGILTGCLLSISACSKNDVNLAAQSSPQPVLIESNRNKAAERVVEIDRLLAVPLTGTPEESDRRAALRAERAALVASGQVPYELRSSSLATRNVSVPPNNTVTQRQTNGDVVNYAAPTTRTAPIIVAPNSQATNLSFIEQMTPSEREHYYKTLKAQNTQRVEVDVRHH